MLNDLYKHKFEDIYADTKKELLKKVLDKYELRQVEYMVFYIWANRLKNTLSFEDKLSLYLRLRLLEREIYLSKKDKYKKRTKDL